MKNFDKLFAELSTKLADPTVASSTKIAVAKGTHFVGKKILEEAGEVWIASEYQTKIEQAQEISQLLYWIQVMMLTKGLELADVYKYL